jgi:hypothetical protein
MSKKSKSIKIPEGKVLLDKDLLTILYKGDLVERVQSLTDLVNHQEYIATVDHEEDPYFIGILNGLKVAQSILTDNEPIMFSIPRTIKIKKPKKRKRYVRKT